MASAGCSAGGVDNRALMSRMRECGLVGPGDVGASVLSAFYVPDRCYSECLAGASCDSLQRALCRTTLDLLVACDERCAHACPDGALIGVEDVCDGIAECADGSDERGCPGWTEIACTDGTRMFGRRCDGIYSCADGSDENGCTVRLCGDRVLYDGWICNGYRECSDGSDESGCPTYTCRSGRTVTYQDEASTPRCNGYAQCDDGSDEVDCARLTLSCSF